MKNLDARVSRLEGQAFEKTLQKYLQRIEDAEDNCQAIKIGEELTKWYASTGREPDTELLESILKAFNPEFEAAVRQEFRNLIEAGEIC
jgi:hypothetical protein